MTRFDPSIQLQRLRVERDGKPVFDEIFHKGVNILRGENSSGKSTILNLIFFVLGGDLKDWSDIALLCTRVVAEVSLSGKVATLARDISDGRGQPMDVIDGPMGDALSAPIGSWSRFTYARSATKESLSQVLFRLLKLPEVTTETSENVTINQVLRLLYADQVSPVDSIFKFEQFDPPTLREAVGRLLCGAFESELYSNQLRIRTLQKEFDEAAAELRSLFQVLGKVDQPTDLGWIAAEKASLERERDGLQAKVEELERQIRDSADADKLSLQAQNELYEELQSVQAAIGQARSERDSLAFEFADSAAFMFELEGKLEALNDASAVTKDIDQVRFHFCPACYAPTEDAPVHACHLCKTPFDSERAKVRIVALITDIALQLRQSAQLQRKRGNRLEELEGKISELRARWEEVGARYSAVQRLPSGALRQELNLLQRQMGYIDRQIEDLATKAGLANIIGDLTNRKDALNAEIGTLQSRNETLRLRQQVRLSNAYTELSDQVRDLLRKDLKRQDSFENPQVIDFDFGANRISVDGHSYVSASSRVMLRNSFFLGFLAAASNDPEFRHPRFCMLDSIEDKGMEVERSHNFQRLIVEKVDSARSECQVIFGTSMIAPELDIPSYTIGKKSTRESRTLAIG